MMKLALGFFICIMFVAETSFAWGNNNRRGDYLYENSFNGMAMEYVGLLDAIPTDNINALPADQKEACQQRYQGLLDDGVLDIRIALGYFDWTTGGPVYAEDRNFGMSPSMDIGAFSSLQRFLQRPCYGNSRFCNFKQDPKNIYRFSRNVTIQGKTYLAKIEIQFSSATEYLNLNLGRHRQQQIQRTEFAEAFFLHALQEADAVFYFGHSRNGGGPDFAPPIFVNGKNKVDYDGYYEVKRPGLKKMMSALTDAKKQAAVVGLMSCASRDHFLRKVRGIAPETGFITSLDVLYVDEVYTAMLGAVDALLRGQCQKSFYNSLRLTPENRRYITMDGMFE